MSTPAIDEKAVFNAGRSIPDPEERERYLREACGHDAETLRQVRELLEFHEGAHGFLESPAAGLAPARDPAPLEGPGSVMGPYRLLERIGEGGFGVVFLAEQTQPVRREVALKVVKPGMDTRQVIARFEAERQALALMDHPNIARVLDAGATEAGRPYFVMELVRGVPITEYCDANHLPPRERLELFVPACQAVQHAHQKGIIHRDIKPSNVLVTTQDDRPVVKVIDFGIAKATSGQLTDRTLFTGFAQLIGTPLYMSPEQASMGGFDVDTRSDVYSLGVVLYELLTGATPFDKARLQRSALDEIQRILREEEPARPSTRLSTSQALPALAANRRTEPARLARLVRGDLDWIVMKALEKDRARRYETAAALAADVRRYLADEPVSACPPSVGYRLRKLARRHRAGLAAAALAGAALLVVAGTLGWTARDRASRRTRSAEAVAALLDRCDDALQADAADRAAIAFGAAERRAADGGAEGLEGRLERSRADLALLLELDAIDAFSWTWTADDAAPPRPVLAGRWRAALAEYGVVAQEGSAERAAARVRESAVRERLLAALDRWLAVEPSAGVRAVLRAADPDPYRDAVRDAILAGDAAAVNALAERPEALAQPGRFAALFPIAGAGSGERQRAVIRTALLARPGDLALLMGIAGSYLAGPDAPAGDPTAVGERVRWGQAAVAAHPRNVPAWNDLGTALVDRGDLDQAIDCFEEAVRLDPTFARGHYNLGVVLAEKGRTAEAAERYREAIRLHPAGAMAHSNLAILLLGAGEPAEAIPLLEEAIRLEPAADRHYNLAIAYEGTGDPARAVEAYRAAIEAKPDYAEAHCNLGLRLRDLGRFAEGLESLRTGHELGLLRSDWKYPSEEWVRECERLVELDAMRPRVLAGETATADTLVELARLSANYHGRYADAARLYDSAFAAEPDLAQELNGRRYDAACAAALASAGRGAGADALGVPEKRRLRSWAIGWLRAELDGYTAYLAGDRPEIAAARAHLGRWLEDPDLAGVRDGLDRSEVRVAERRLWEDLWGDVRALQARLAGG